MLANFNVDKAILSCKGVDLMKGVTDSNEADAEVKNIMRSCAKQTILAVDSSKFDNVSFIKVMAVLHGVDRGFSQGIFAEGAAGTR